MPSTIPYHTTAHDAVHWLQETGTPDATLDYLRLWVDSHRTTDQPATGTDLLAYCIKEEVNPGTINKLGQFLYGSAWRGYPPPPAPPS